MAETTYAPIDKSTWGDGPWVTEPDRAEWTHAGLPCLALRHPRMGNWCGYVAVPPGHVLHGRGYSDESPALSAALEQLKARPLASDDLTFKRTLAMLTGEVASTPDVVLDVHGGLTYAAKCNGPICHVPKAGEPDDVWWFGFDCAHAGDFQPAYHARYMHHGYPFDDQPYDHAKAIAANDWSVETYRTLDYVRAQANALAAQLAVLEQPEAVPAVPNRDE